jgi:hypothetical protein
MKRITTLLFCLLIVGCGKGPEIPAPELLEATVEVGGQETVLTNGFLYESPYSSSDSKEYILILMEDQKGLAKYINKTRQHKGPAITDRLQLSFYIREVPDGFGDGFYNGQMLLENLPGSSEITILFGLVPKGAEDVPHPDSYPGEYEVTTVDGQEVWHLTLEHEETQPDGTVNRVKLEAKLPLIQLGF